MESKMKPNHYHNFGSRQIYLWLAEEMIIGTDGMDRTFTVCEEWAIDKSWWSLRITPAWPFVRCRIRREVELMLFELERVSGSCSTYQIRFSALFEYRQHDRG